MCIPSVGRVSTGPSLSTSAMLSIFGRAGATPVFVVEKSHALSCFMTVDKRHDQ